MSLEFGLSIRPTGPDEDLALIVEAERLGFDTALFGDSQNAFASPFVRMGNAARATSTITLATCGVPAGTRHPAMAAGEAVTVHTYSGGRAVLGLARGDSALSMIGRRIPGPLAEFGDFARAVRGYLRGETVDCDGHPSRLTWLPAGLPPVPLDIAVTGPKSIALAATIADRVSFAVGTAPDRIEWALEIARSAAESVGRDPAEISFGAFVNCLVSDDVDAAARAMCTPIAYSCHFSAMPETDVNAHPPVLRRITEPLREAFLTKNRTPVSCIDPEFARWWGAVGTAGDVIARLGTLRDLGISRFYLLNGAGPRPDLTESSLRALADVVLPALRPALTPEAAR